MTDYVSTTPGLYPLPDWAKDDLSALKGHQRDDLIAGDEGPEIEGVYADAREEAIGTQAAAGIDLIVEGQLRWDDMLAHPLCVHDAVETRGLERYYDNNNFYREPVVTAELDFDGDVSRELDAAVALADRVQAVLPGPYSLADLATDDYYGDDRRFLDAVAGFLAGEVDALPDTDSLFLLEPSLAFSPPSGPDADAVVDAIDRVADAASADVVVHTYWGTMSDEVYSGLVDTGLAGVGFDLVNAPEASRALAAEHGTPDAVALGVVDGQNTLIESPATIRARIERFEDATADPPGTVYVTSNTELFYLPVPRFEDKLDALAAATAAEVAA